LQERKASRPEDHGEILTPVVIPIKQHIVKKRDPPVIPTDRSQRFGKDALGFYQAIMPQPVKIVPAHIIPVGLAYLKYLLEDLVPL